MRIDWRESHGPILRGRTMSLEMRLISVSDRLLRRHLRDTGGFYRKAQPRFSAEFGSTNELSVLSRVTGAGVFDRPALIGRRDRKPTGKYSRRPPRPSPGSKQEEMQVCNADFLHPVLASGFSGIPQQARMGNTLPEIQMHGATLVSVDLYFNKLGQGRISQGGGKTVAVADALMGQAEGLG
ncbi:hypothetical protein Thiosp_01793 [Thiorhodovibrio litoralis]|nr:hypothetical protein Thiosp_01793 [Thiorhodovibrio litoralis]